MRSSAAARRYARALFSLARDDGRVDEVRGELDTVAALLDESPTLKRTLMTPLHPAGQRKRVLAAVAERVQMSPVTLHFHAFLIDQRRLVDFPAIHDEFSRLAEESSGLTTAEVVSASPLDDRKRDRLRRALSARTGREVRLEVRVDPDLIGGAVARVGDMVFDGSLRTQIGQLRANLTKGSRV